jgi:REP element-mobilizing transposase RayT
MTRPLRIEYPGAFYHITSRGNERKDIFKSLRDREKFLSYLESATKRYGAVIHAYCLMDSHYHLFIETPLGNLSKIIHHINGAYTNYYNKRLERAGHLFQGRYKAILVEADAYAKELSRYIHLNPVRAGMADNPEEYPWSSCRYYISNEKTPGWLKRDLVLNCFSSKPGTAIKMYKEFVNRLSGQKYESPLTGLSHNIMLVSKEFVNEIKERYLREKKADRNLPVLKKLSEMPDLEMIEQVVDKEIQTDKKKARQVRLHICHCYSGKSLREIGERFGVSDSGVTQASRRIDDKQKTDKKLKKLILKIIEDLKM